ncbi:MAG: MarR family transcriptional regulator [Thaumarchaeota archaeon]|nr:MarR family transcriptional regulator [Nitrososphaerota archaeon]
MNFTPLRYKMLFYMLTHYDGFGQREIADYLGIKFGATVNSFVKQLVQLGYVSQTGPSKKGGKKYVVTSPLELISFYSKFRKMELHDRFSLAMKREETINYLSERGAIFCLNTALEEHKGQVTDPAIYAYLPEEHFLEDEIKFLARGDTPVYLYKYDFEDNPVTIKNKKITSKVRTLIDLYCENKAYIAEALAKEFGN